jgi:dipeptidyl aminopeptidase/acylaminoacyl peptidase
MKNKRMITRGILIIILLFITYYLYQNSLMKAGLQEITLENKFEDENKSVVDLHPLAIEHMRNQQYPGSKINIEQTLKPGINYQRHIASYNSDGLKIFGLLTIPDQTNSNTNELFPAIIFNHGYLNPDTYITTERYVAYQDAFAQAGYVTYKPDFRGHGNSEGEASGGHFSPDYTIDTLNAVSSIQGLKSPTTNLSIVNPEKIGMWGHSMGGGITLRSMVVSDKIQAGVVWAGVVSSYEDLLKNYEKRIPWIDSIDKEIEERPDMKELLDEYGEPSDESEFWRSISPIFNLKYISGSIQLQHGTADHSVPVEFSISLETELKNNKREVELYLYEKDDHNISNNLSLALSRSVEFFDKHLKN